MLLVAPRAAPARVLTDGLVPLTSDDDGLGMLAVGVLMGLWLIYDGFRTWQQLRLMQDTPTEPIRSVAVGRTELNGTAGVLEGTVDRPFTDGECLVATYEIEEYESDDDGGHWDTIDEGVIARDFALDDGTGTIRVAPTEDATYEISEQYRTELTVGGSEREPPAVREFLRTHSSAAAGDATGLTGMLFDSKRRYTEAVIPPKTALYVLGGATPMAEVADSNPDRLVLSRDEASDEFILSDKSEDALVSSYRWRAPAEIVGGLALSSVTLFLLLSALGV